jgi:hypothetical protein
MGLRYAIAVLGAMILASATAFLSAAVEPEMVGAATPENQTQSSNSGSAARTIGPTS